MKLKHIFFFMTATMSLSANAAPLYSSLFTDNSNKVTEVRTFGENSVETWEWLDLNVTNGLSFKSVQQDLADDGVLNGTTTLLGNSGALNDIAGLSESDQIGWEIQDIQSVYKLVNNFFDLGFELSLFDIPNWDLYASFANETYLVDRFVSYFGDTFIEGAEDSGNLLISGNPNISLSRGMSKTSVWGGLKQMTIVDTFMAYNDDIISSQGDIRFETDLSTGMMDVVAMDTGVWLARKLVVQVNAPSTLLLMISTFVLIGFTRICAGRSLR